MSEVGSRPYRSLEILGTNTQDFILGSGIAHPWCARLGSGRWVGFGGNGVLGVGDSRIRQVGDLPNMGSAQDFSLG